MKVGTGRSRHACRSRRPFPYSSSPWSRRAGGTRGCSISTAISSTTGPSTPVSHHSPSTKCAISGEPLATLTQLNPGRRSASCPSAPLIPPILFCQRAVIASPATIQFIEPRRNRSFEDPHPSRAYQKCRAPGASPALARRYIRNHGFPPRDAPAVDQRQNAEDHEDVPRCGRSARSVASASSGRA